MSSVLSGIKIAVLGGDDREIILVSELVKMGATVVTAGIPRDRLCHGAFSVNTVEDACKESEVVIMPLPGTNPEGLIRAVYTDEKMFLTEQAISSMASNALVLIGSARPFLQQWAKKYNFTLLEVVEMDELAILNSIPTAEGAIQIAMEETPITIHGSNICIIGFGRIAITLARNLKSLGAQVTVVARNDGQLARAYEMGCLRASYTEIRDIMNSCDIVYNTVPSMVLDRNVLTYAHPHIVRIALATPPGGTDFEAAKAFGLKAILAPGLP
ncbi:MAG: dipicolinate synthase subunit DpsA, partial [Syntrophomonas sp.]